MLKEHIFRVVRKKLDKIMTFDELETKDGWKLQVTAVTVMNRNTNIDVRKKIRELVKESLRAAASKSSIDEFVKSAIGGTLQMNIKKAGNKIYPVRFSEIEKIEVLSPGGKK